MGESIALRPAANRCPINAETEPPEGVGCCKPVGRRFAGAQHSFPELFNLIGYGLLSISTGTSGMPTLLALLTARFQIIGIQGSEPSVADAQLKSPGFHRDLSITKLHHQVADESGTMAPTQLLIRFFSCQNRTPCRLFQTRFMPKTVLRDKLARNGRFNARKAEGLIAPQHPFCI